MKKFLYSCIAAFAMLLASCDKDADNVKMVRVSGSYNGVINASLYLPDYDVEEFNIFMYEMGLNKDSLGSIASDKNMAQVVFNFATDDQATINIRNLTGLNFDINYLIFNYDEKNPENNIYSIHEAYQDGLFAQAIGVVDKLHKAGKVSENDFYTLIAKAECLKDEISFNDIATEPLKMRERGAIYSTYDFEQNSLYEKVRLRSFGFSRKTNITDITTYMQQLVAPYLADLPTEDVALLQDLLAKTVTEGTISDASGWCCLSYSNYRPWLELTIDNATGMLDVLNMALFGEKKKDKQLLLDITYEGNIDTMDSYQKVQE